MEDYGDTAELDPPSISNLTLRYPTLNLNDAIADSTGEHLPTMRPPISRQTSEASSSLGDSAYDFVSIGDISDDTRTESLASVDGETPDDMSVITSNDGSDREDESDQEEEDVTPHRDIRSDSDPLVNVQHAVEGSGFTSETVRPSTASSLAYLDFADDPTEGQAANGESNLVHVVQSIEETNTSRELSLYGSPHVGLSLHMSVLNDMPKPRSTFHLLVLSYHKHLTHEIARHIDSALRVASFEFGNLSDTDLKVSQCISTARHDNGFVLRLDGESNESIYVSGGKVLESENSQSLPDLAVFLHPSLADVPAFRVSSVEKDYSTTRHAMLSCQIPVMDLSEYAPLFQAAPTSYTRARRSMYLRVTTLDTKAWESQIAELLPVDLEKFLSIDPLLLSRHLACVTRKRNQATILPKAPIPSRLTSALHTVQTVSIEKCRQLRAEYYGEIRKCRQLRAEYDGEIQKCSLALKDSVSYVTARVGRQELFCGFAIICGLFSLFNAYNAISPLFLSLSDVRDLSSYAFVSVTPQASLTSTYISATIQPPVASTSPPSKAKEFESAQAEVMQAIEKAVGQLLTPAAPNPLPKPQLEEQVFDVNIVGDNHIILTPARIGNKPKVSVSVSRKLQVLKTESRRIPATGTYIIEIEREQAYGCLNVSIKWPKNEQVVNVDLGSPWLKASTWGRAANDIREAISNDIAAAQSNARSISVRMTTGVQKFRKVAVNVAREKLNKAVAVAPSKDVQWQVVKEFEERTKSISRVLENQRDCLMRKLEIGKTAKVIQNTAVSRYYNAVDIIRAVDVQKIVPSVSVDLGKVIPAVVEVSKKRLIRGRNNAKDLWQVIGQHTANLRRGCGKEYEGATARCGLICAKQRAIRCEFRKLEEKYGQLPEKQHQAIQSIQPNRARRSSSNAKTRK